MREIKFRMYGKYDKIMRSFDDLLNNFTTLHVLNDALFEVMQFTGLKDKNGKEIYEGDIVKIDERYSGDMHLRVMFEEVIFQDGMFTTDAWGDGLASDCLNNLVTVVGNIYENKELIK